MLGLLLRLLEEGLTGFVRFLYGFYMLDFWFGVEKGSTLNPKPLNPKHSAFEHEKPRLRWDLVHLEQGSSLRAHVSK